MKGLRLWNVKYFALSLVVVLGCFFCSLIINQNNASAVSDFVFNIDSTSSFPLILCSNPASSTYPSCGSYTFVKFEPVYSVTPTNTNNSYFTISGFYGTRLPTFLDTTFKLNSFISGLTMTSWNSNLSSLKVTFYNSDSSTPSGSITLTENGTYDVTDYAEAVVDVPPEVVQGDYHDDLVNLKQAVIFVPAVALIIYFFYAIYKMLLGGKTL